VFVGILSDASGVIERMLGITLVDDKAASELGLIKNNALADAIRIGDPVQSSPFLLYLETADSNRSVWVGPNGIVEFSSKNTPSVNLARQ
jgi:hypothetical protein